MDLTVVFKSQTQEAHCDQVREGENGLVLLRSNESQIGSIPYHSLDYVLSSHAEHE